MSFVTKAYDKFHMLTINNVNDWGTSQEFSNFYAAQHILFWSVNYYQLIKYSKNFVKSLMALRTIMLSILIEKAILVSQLLLFNVRW